MIDFGIGRMPADETGEAETKYICNPRFAFDDRGRTDVLHWNSRRTVLP